MKSASDMASRSDTATPERVGHGVAGTVTTSVAGTDTTSLASLCREALACHREGGLRWFPVDRYLEKTDFSTDEARAMARHLMHRGGGRSYEDGARILQAIGEPDLETILPLHREGIEMHRASTMWSLAPSATWTGLAVMAKALRNGGLEACRLAERIEETMRTRCR